ncbi:uncharacterized protein [Neodiprion pinetum]|uniref:uncharacterized protein n=1 Tax=Neodiprion pinetum TaxID=441929 RepID=UPI001EDE2B17|nr:uncharacterized protein LOC124212279 [Neodiprion pinetum]
MALNIQRSTDEEIRDNGHDAGLLCGRYTYPGRGQNGPGNRKEGNTGGEGGIYLDSKLSFSTHLEKSTNKTIGTMKKIGRIMPNIGEPRQTRRRLLARVGESIAFYGAQIWGKETIKDARAKKLRDVHRVCAKRVSSAYRTVSNTALAVVARIQPLELTAQQRSRQWECERRILKAGNDLPRTERKAIHKHEGKNAATWTLQQWKNGWASITTTSQWTKRLIGNLEPWLKRKHEEGSYQLPQALTGHGPFNHYEMLVINHKLH